MTAALQSPGDEFRSLQQGMAQCRASLEQLIARNDIPEHAKRDYCVQARQWLEQATQRMRTLRGQVQVIPQPPMTPAQATHAMRDAGKSEKKRAKQMQKMKGMAMSMIGSMPQGSKEAGVASLLLDEGQNPAARTAALHQLIDLVPLNSPMAPLIKTMGKSLLTDDDDDE